MSQHPGPTPTVQLKKMSPTGATHQAYFKKNNDALATYRSAMAPGGVAGRTPGKPWTKDQMTARRAAFATFKQARADAMLEKKTRLKTIKAGGVPSFGAPIPQS